MDLQSTQVVNEDNASDDNENVTQVGILRVGTTDHPIVEGFTKIGRNPALCKIVIKDATVSSVHAEIQAGCETAFVSDVRSANGTKIKDVALKPFFYYEINDGSAIYFGTVKATYTTNQSSNRSARTRLDTPLPSKRSGGKNTPGFENASDCLFNNSSVYQSDDSVIPGTQQRRKDNSTFQEPPPPTGRRWVGNRASIGGNPSTPITPSGSAKFEKPNETTSYRDAVAESADIHDLETQRFDSPSNCRSPAAKRSLDAKFERESIDEDIYEAETQVPHRSPENVEAPIEKEICEARENAAAGSSARGRNSSSNISRQLRISASPSPPNSPNITDPNQDVDESQNLLEMCDTPLLELTKEAKTDDDANESVQRETSPKSDAGSPEASKIGKSSSRAMETTTNRGKFVISDHVIAETDDESETDDDIDIAVANEPPVRVEKTVMPVSRPSDLIDDGSETDDEGHFESLASRSGSKDGRALAPKNLENNDVEGNIFEASTQKVVRESNANAAKEMDYDSDIDLLPTQILDVPTSTPVLQSRKINQRNFEKTKTAIDDDDDNDLHIAPTQILNDESDVAVRDAKKSFVGSAVPRSGVGNGKAGKKNDSVNLDDSLAKNLGRILDQEANSYDSTDEPTQLMTQNLVDILKPTQSVEEMGTRDFEDDGREPLGAKRRKVSSYETLGFVKGHLVTGNRRAESPTIAASTMKNDEEIEIAVGQTRESDLNDDDILAGLPEVKISGTLSNPGSPCSSIASSHSDFVAPRSKKPDESAKLAKSIVAKSTEKPIESLETVEAGKPSVLDSPVLSRRTRITRRRSPRKLIDDEEQDSDEVFGYNDLKKLADSLLASDSAESAQSRKKDNGVATHDESGSSSSTGRRTRHVRKDIPSKINPDSNPRTRKLSPSHSSLVVADGKGKRSGRKGIRSIDVESSSAEISKKLPSLRKSKKSAPSKSKIAAKPSEESQEVEAILTAPLEDDISLIARKSYATVKLKRLINVDDADGSETPTINRKRRATVSAKDTKPEPTTPASTKKRRTMGDAFESPKLSKEQHRILITGLDKDDYSKIVKKLGGTVVAEPSKATVLITDKVRRTYKFLCAVARGLRVVSINWLLDSHKASRFLPSDDFILNDPVAERQWNFKLAKSLETARTKKMLEGYVVVVTPKVNQPVIPELKGMVEACGGKLLTRAPGVRAWNSKTVIVSRAEDLTAIKALLSKCPKSVKVTVQTTEFILTGILRQEVNLVEHKLDIS